GVHDPRGLCHTDRAGAAAACRSAGGGRRAPGLPRLGLPALAGLQLFAERCGRPHGGGHPPRRVGPAAPTLVPRDRGRAGGGREPLQTALRGRGGGGPGALGLFLLVPPALRGTAGDEAGPPRRRPAARGPQIADALPALQFTLGLGLVLGPALGLLAWAGALRDLVERAIVVPLRGATQFAAYPRLPALRPFLKQDPQMRAQVDSYFPSILLTLSREEMTARWRWRPTTAVYAGSGVVFPAPLHPAAALSPSNNYLPAGPGDRRRAHR